MTNGSRERIDDELRPLVQHIAKLFDLSYEEMDAMLAELGSAVEAHVERSWAVRPNAY